MKWTEVPSGEVFWAFQRLMEALGTDANVTIDRINNEPSFVEMLALCAKGMPPLRAYRFELTTQVAPLVAPLTEVEHDHIVRVLQQVRGKKAVAARKLGVSRRAFYRLLERHGLHHSVPKVKISATV